MTRPPKNRPNQRPKKNSLRWTPPFCRRITSMATQRSFAHVAEFRDPADVRRFGVSDRAATSDRPTVQRHRCDSRADAGAGTGFGAGDACHGTLAATQQFELQQVAESVRTLADRLNESRASGSLASSRDTGAETLPEKRQPIATVIGSANRNRGMLFYSRSFSFLCSSALTASRTRSSARLAQPMSRRPFGRRSNHPLRS